ncbi:MAG: DUF5106 domain-containing protein [Sphingobacterium composti]
MKEISFICFAICILLFGCGRDVNNSSSEKQVEIDKDFIPPSAHIQTIDGRLLHFWDDFNFQDENKATSAEYGEQHLVDFISLFPRANSSTIAQSTSELIQKSSTNPTIRQYFEELLRRYLYDVNSPFYNEDYYIIVLQTLINSDGIPSANKTKYHTLLKIATKNQVGTKATSFEFHTNGKTMNLYDIKKEYTILFFYEPTCNSCRETIELLKSSTQFNSLLKEKVTMLAMYPDGDKAIWAESLQIIPSTWINGIDLSKKVLQEGLYDLKASPTIYLLDQDKKVLLKDTSTDQLLDYLKNV